MLGEYTMDDETAAESAAPEGTGGSSADKPPAWKRFLPLGVIAIALALFFLTGLNEYFTLDTLKENREWLVNFAADNRLVAPLVLIAIYAAAVAISFPGASILSIFAGFMFGTWIGGTAVLFGATIGATIIFLAARNATGDALLAKAGPTLKKLEAGFRESELSYMFLLRLVPAFPFWLVNLAPAALGVKLRNYMIATFSASFRAPLFMQASETVLAPHSMQAMRSACRS